MQSVFGNLLHCRSSRGKTLWKRNTTEKRAREQGGKVAERIRKQTKLWKQMFWDELKCFCSPSLCRDDNIGWSTTLVQAEIPQLLARLPKISSATSGSHLVLHKSWCRPPWLQWSLDFLEHHFEVDICSLGEMSWQLLLHCHDIKHTRSCYSEDEMQQLQWSTDFSFTSIAIRIGHNCIFYLLPISQY